MRKVYKVSLIIIGGLGIILSLITTSYAYWLGTKYQTNSNKISTRCLDISISGEANDITLLNNFPITDEAGENTVPYTFTVTNNCNKEVDYQLALESIGPNTNRLSASDIKVKLDNKKAKTLDKYSSVDPTITNAYASHKLATGTLSASGTAGSSVSFALRLWIDENVTIESNNKSFESKISVTVGHGIVKKTIICNAVTSETKTTGNIPNGEYNYGDEYICNLDNQNYHFFVLEDGDNTTLENGLTGSADADEVTLIMDRNYIDANVPETMPWCDQNGANPHNNICNHDGLDPYLNYIQEKFKSDVVVGLPSREQLAAAEPVNSNETHFLIGNISEGLGYWTSSKWDNDSEHAVYETGSRGRVVWDEQYHDYVYQGPTIYGYELFGEDTVSDYFMGIRPTITLSKELID